MPPLELPLGLGTSGLDDPAECRDTVTAALEAGYRHVDTAQMYDNEVAVGEGIAAADVDRDDVTVATKVHPDNLAPEAVRETARESLDRLGLDRVDLLYVHWPTGAYDPDATLPAFDALRDEGVTDHVGVSNFTPALLREADRILDAPIAAHQVECHPRFQQPALRELAAEFDHRLVGYSPLARGDLFGDDAFVEIAERHDRPPAVLALGWALARDVTPIPKATGDHVAENLRAVNVEISEAALDAVDALERGERRLDPDDTAWNR
ncbi:aldehyde oxidoreductase [Halorubrum persicum]|uniref:Aldehyde oxidoreductase n=1 Tax=Halorubrum persicum TaxID=1383844 RepID=A0A2G1WEU2_9EURY|nr:aldo/keto reductase [Halorubrum persicum]PHQ37490.1 aldehyde oxidoreductase [Halorubrum persicum]